MSLVPPTHTFGGGGFNLGRPAISNTGALVGERCPVEEDMLQSGVAVVGEGFS